jgi:hypothetical protein
MASEVNERLHRAAMDGDVEGIAAALLAGADPEAFVNTWSPLHWAANNGHIAAIAALLKAGARVDGANSKGYTPLMRAAPFGNTAVIDALLSAGADVHRADKRGNSTLHCATMWGSVNTVRALLEAGARTDVRDKEGKRPIDVVRAPLPFSPQLGAKGILPRHHVAMRRFGTPTSPMRPPFVHCSPPLHPGPAAGPSPSPATAWSGSGSGRREARGWRWWMRDVSLLDGGGRRGCLG